LLMVMFTKESGLKVKKKDKESMCLLMEMNIKVNLKRERKVDMVLIIGKKEINIQDNGKMI